MTDDTLSGLEAIAAERRRAGPHGPVVQTETMAGPVLVRTQSIAGHDPFEAWHLDLTEVAETLEIATTARVYEDIRIVKTETTELRRIEAVLRREEAAVDIQGRIGPARIAPDHADRRIP